MNQFRDLSAVALIALGIGLLVSDPNDWKWADAGGTYVIQALGFLSQMHPIASILCFAVAGVLFMTRVKY